MFDVLPPSALDGLTPEDFRLLLNGVGDFNVSVLISYTNFIDESSPNPHEPSPRLLKLKRWLWSIVEKMTPVERMDLVSFGVAHHPITLIFYHKYPITFLLLQEVEIYWCN